MHSRGIPASIITAALIALPTIPAHAQSAPTTGSDPNAAPAGEITIGEPVQSDELPATPGPPVQVLAPPASFALAQPALGEPDRILAYQLQQTLRYYARQDRLQRTFSGSAFIAAGAGFAIASGFAFSDRALVVAGWISIGAAAGFLTGGVVLLLVPRPIERLSSDYDGWLRTEQNPRFAINRAESRWANLAEQARTSRVLGGATAIVLGGLFIAGGLGFAALAPHGTGFSVAERGYIVGISTAAGAAYILAGAALLGIDSEFERGLALWRAGHALPASQSIRIAPPSVAVFDHGGGVSLSGSFH